VRSESQSLIPLSELWRPFSSGTFGESLFMVIEGYFDESIDNEWFTLGAVFSTGLSWQWLSVDWDRCVKRWSKKMVASGRKPLRRYHGTDCAGRNEDFDGWTEHEQQEFLAELRGIMDVTNGVHSLSLSLRPKELSEVFEIRGDKRLKRACYEVLLQYVMLQLGRDIHSRNPGYEHCRVALFHDHTKFYDAWLNSAFFAMKEDPSFLYRQYFTTIAPMTWEDCIALQPADMVAFETRKQAIRKTQGHPLGGELQKLLDLPSFGGQGLYFDRENLEELRVVLAEINHKLGHVKPTAKTAKKKLP
jgi:hypothetical protein